MTDRRAGLAENRGELAANREGLAGDREGLAGQSDRMTDGESGAGTAAETAGVQPIDTDGMTDGELGTATATEAAGVQPLDPAQLDVYFVLMEAVSLLQHQVEQQLRAEGDISYVQFQLLARLASADGPLTMTELADGVVYSRSGLTYQAGLLEKAGLAVRGPSPDDDRSTLVTIT